MNNFLSAIQLGMLFKCPHQYKLRYINGKKRPPGISAYIGRSVDESVNQNLQNIIDNGIFLPKEQVIDIARDSLNKEWEEETPLLTDEEKQEGDKKIKGKCVDTSISLAKLHYDKVAPIIKPKQIQREWKITVAGFPYDLIGYMDIVEDRAIRDTKTSKIRKTGAADKSMQLTLYALAGKVLDKKDYQLFLDYLVANKTPVKDIQSTTRTQKDFEKLFIRLEIAAKFIESGIFPPANSEISWWCDPRYCGYYEKECRYA